MIYKGCIFDLDGTLLDSMHVWDDFALAYLREKGILCQQPLHELFATMRMEEAAAYLHAHFLKDESIERIETELYARLMQRYEALDLKPGVKSCVDSLYDQGIRLSVFSANHSDVCKTSLAKHGLLDRFVQILSCEEIHLSKTDPDSYRFVCDQMHLRVRDCVVVEDALHAIQGAKKAGCHVVGVKEESQKSDWEDIRKQADDVIEDMRELEAIICRK